MVFTNVFTEYTYNSLVNVMESKNEEREVSK